MSIRKMNVKVSGISPLLLNNPQTVDRFNPYAKEIAKINAKKTRRTDEDYRRLADLEVRSKIYWDEEEKQIYVPSTWVMAAITGNSFKRAKISKADIRGSVFMTEDKIPLSFRNKRSVKTPEDIVGNPDFRHAMILKQGQVRISKSTPIFHDWSFETNIEYDETVIDPETLERVLVEAGKFGGYGDFRPTFGRSSVEVIHD